MQSALKLARSSIPAAYALLMAYAAVTGLLRPIYNWDMVGYVGSVVSWGREDPAAIYSTTMSELKSQIPGWVYDQFTKNPLSAEPKALMQQLPFYQVKPLYTGLMWLLNAATVPLAATTWWIAALGFLALAFQLYRWQSRYLPQWAWLLMIIALSFLGEWPLAANARFSTPDSLCMALLFASLHGWLAKKSAIRFCVLGLLAALARPDALLFSGAFTAYFAAFAPKQQRMDLKIAISFIAILFLAYVTVNKLAGSYGWERLFIYSFVNKTIYPAEATDHLTLATYLRILHDNFWLQIKHPREIVMLALSAIAFFSHYMKPMKENRLPRDLLLLMWATIAARFMMFPAWGDERYYYPYYIVILYASGELITPYAYTLAKLIKSHRSQINESKEDLPS